MYLPDFLWKYRRPITLIVLLCSSCLLMVDSFHRRWVAHAGGELMLGLTSPAQKTSESIHDGARNLFSVIPDFVRTRTQNAALRKRVGELEQEIVALREQLIEERRERGLIHFTEQVDGTTIIARVIGSNPTAWFGTVIVDKGSSHGVHKGSPALSSSGLAGHVIEVYLYSSKVLLLTDSNSRVGAVVQRSRAQGVVQGDDEGGCLLKYLEPTADITEGDLLVTSGNSSIYPKGLLVGSVSELRNRPGNLFQWARVVPATDFEKLEEVAIIVGGEPEGASDEGAPTE